MNTKFSSLNPTCIKDNNMNCVNIFDTNLRSKKSFDDGFKSVTKFKRNFKQRNNFIISFLIVFDCYLMYNTFQKERYYENIKC